MTDELLEGESRVRNLLVGIDGRNARRSRPSKRGGRVGGFALVLALMTAIAFRAEAGTVTLKDTCAGAIDWTDGANYTAEAPPGTGDTVLVPGGVSVILTDADRASWQLVNAVKAVKLDDGAICEIEVTGASATFACPLQSKNHVDAGPANPCWFRKAGTGELLLTSTYGDAYQACFDVQSGAVKLPAVATQTMTVEDVNIAAGASFYVAGWNDADTADRQTSFRGLTGAGTLKSSTAKRVKVVHLGAAGRTDVFSGVIDGVIWMNVAGRLDITGDGTLNKSTAARVQAGGVYGFVHPTNAFGASGNIGMTGTGTFRYLGTEPLTLGKQIYTSGSYTLTLDAGPYGGLTYSGEARSAVAGKYCVLDLSGSNAVDAVLSWTANFSAENTGWQLRKTGTGTWKISAPSSNSRFDGAVYVEEGRLKFTTIANLGLPCSLGSGTNCYKNKEGASTAANRVDYQVALGGAGTEGILDYVGTTDGICTDRRFAVRARGGVYADQSTNKVLKLAGFSASEAGGGMLVLGGENHSRNVADGLSDGAGPLGVEKRGGGRWALTCENSTLTGALVVREGTLSLNNVPVGAPFTFFRLVLKENAFAACTNGTSAYYANLMAEDNKRWTNNIDELKNFALSRIAIYDRNGTNLVRDLDYAINVCTAEAGYLDYGHYQYAGPVFPKTAAMTPGNQSLKSAFEWDTMGPQATTSNSDDRMNALMNDFIDVNSPSTWATIEFRLPADSAEAVGYDIRGRSAYIRSDTGQFRELAGRALVSWELQGSADGVHYETLHAVNQYEFPEKSGDYWYAHPAYTAVKPNRTVGDWYHFGKTNTTVAFSAVPAFSTVYVASNAVLEVVGAPLALNALTLDRDGLGCLKNVSMAETGTLDLVGLDAAQTTTYPADFSQVPGYANLAGWAVRVNGMRRSNSRISVTAAGVVFHKPGFVVNFR